MTRSELVEKVSAHFPDIGQAKIDQCVQHIISEISGTLSKGGRVELRGFGVFEARHRKPRVGRNPRTGDQVQVPAKYIPFFKAGKQLKQTLNDNAE